MPDTIPEAGHLYFWSDSEPGCTRLARLLKQAGLRPRRLGNAVAAAFRADDLGPLWPLLQAALSEEELIATRALLKADDQPPGFADFVNVLSLKRLLAAVERRWIAGVLAADALASHFQPIVCAVDPRRVFAHEALLRATDLDGSTVSAGRLFAAAREAGLTAQLDRAARHCALRSARRVGLDTALFINFVPSAVADPRSSLEGTVRLALEAGFDPHRIVFEVVESEDYGDLPGLQGVLMEYRRAGFRIALDDLGAGYASLNRLTQLRPDIVKLDMALVRGIDADSYKAELAHRLVELAHSLGCEIVAEGVETAGEMAVVRALDVEYVQGFYIARPMPAPLPQPAVEPALEPAGRPPAVGAVA
ncbi:MAG TPA: EAL domain-containing protein [Alphaproteobacteria bacterium]|nr:EAL domain-containing protein [Alphaproteobacteria bacterium]